MDDKLIETLRGFTEAIRQLRSEVQILKERVVAVEKKLLDPPPPPPPPPPGFTTRRGDTVYFRGKAFEFVQWGPTNSRIKTIDGAPSALLKNRTDTDTCPNNELFQDPEGTRRIARGK